MSIFIKNIKMTSSQYTYPKKNLRLINIATNGIDAIIGCVKKKSQSKTTRLS